MPTRCAWVGGIAFGAISLKTWNSLSADQQKTLQSEIDKLTDRMWEETGKEDALAIQCLTGKECPLGPVGGMKLVEPSAEDIKKQKKIAQDVVVKNWAARCDAECVDTWNKVVGPIVASPPRNKKRFIGAGEISLSPATVFQGAHS